VSNFRLEACVETYEESLFAHQHKASQLELCSSLNLDGLTPNISLSKKILNDIKIPIKVMIRNRSGNFVYSEDDVKIMLHQIEEFKALKIQGFALGALTESNDLDFTVLKTLCKKALPYPITVHKCVDQLKDINQLIRLKEISNIKFVLSSGGKETALLGIEKLKAMKELLSPEIQIIPAGKITSLNVHAIHDQLGVNIYHGRKIVG